MGASLYLLQRNERKVCRQIIAAAFTQLGRVAAVASKPGALKVTRVFNRESLLCRRAQRIRRAAK